MASNTIKDTIQIKLDMQGLDAARTSTRDLTESIKAGGSNFQALSDASEATARNIQALRTGIQESANRGADVAEIFSGIASDTQAAVKALDEQALKLSYSLTEQGKAEREELKRLKEIANDQTKSDKERAKARREAAKLERRVFDASDEQLQTQLRMNVAQRVELQTLRQNVTISKTLRQLVREDLKGIRDKIKAQKEFIQSLRTTEGRYNAIKKAASIGKTAIKAGGAAVAAGIGIAGAVASKALSSAGDVQEKLKAAQSLSIGGSLDSKTKLLDFLYIKTGKSFDEIAKGVNSLAKYGLRYDEIRQVGAQVLENPAIVELASMQRGGASVDVLQKLANSLHGFADKDAMQAATQRTLTRSRRQLGGRATMSEITRLDATLSGVFSDNEREQIMRRVLNGYNDSGAANLSEYMKSVDVNKLTRSRKNVAIDFSDISNNGTTKPPVDEAQKALEAVRTVEITVQTLLQKVLKSVVDSGVLDMIIKVMKLLSPVAEKLLNGMFTLINGVVKLVEKFIPKGEDNAGGGFINTRSIVGEHGLPEIVTPLANPARAVSIQQTFNLNHNPSTLSMASAFSGATYKGIF